jgi:anti-sigma B factor antagonist
MSSAPHDDRTQTVVRVGGEIDLNSSRDFGTQLERAISDGAQTVIVDLTGVAFMDSAGVNTILNARALAERLGARLVLRRPDGEAGRILDIFGL